MSNLVKKFRTPADRYTPFPFWFWNDRLTTGEIKRQMDDFYAKGIRGFVLHPRIGWPDDLIYLGDEFFEYVRFAVGYAEQLGMKVILYDEGMYPSGSCNGKVVADHPEYASKGLYVVKAADFTERVDRYQKIVLAFDWSEGKVRVTQAGDYFLVHEDSMGTIRGVHYGEDDGEIAAPRSTDLLDSQAIRYFISLTHERYYQELATYFGKTVLGFFTDEPDILGRNHHAEMLPFNDELATRLMEHGWHLEQLPLLFLPNDQKESLNQAFQQLVTAQLETSYYGPISHWCQTHGIFLTGHPHDAHDIGLLHHFQIPGQDVVWRWIAPEKDLGVKGYEAVTAKCAADAARHARRSRNLNEVFGCCGPAGNQWAFTVSDMKWYLDWLFIRGCNLIVPHAFFYSIAGKRQDERAPDVGPHNLWWPYFGQLSDFIKRMSFMMSDQVNTTNIAIIVEIAHLPYEQVELLYQNQIEFNYLEDRYLLADKFSAEDGKLVVADQHYDTLIVEENHPRLADLLAHLAKYNGEIVILTAEKELSEWLPYLQRRYNGSLQIIGQTRKIRYTEFIKENQRFFGLCNEGSCGQQLKLVFPDTFEAISLWDPWRGSVVSYPLTDHCLEYCLENRGLVFFTEAVTEVEELPTCRNRRSVVIQSEPNAWPDLDFSGTVTYELKFGDLSKLPEKLSLDLGRVENFATLLVNGQERETCFWAPYRFCICRKELQKARIQVAVTNTLSNRYSKIPLASGLFGPIQLEW